MHRESPKQRRARQERELAKSIEDGTHSAVRFIVDEINKAGIQTVPVLLKLDVGTMEYILEHTADKGPTRYTWFEIKAVVDHFRANGESIEIYTYEGEVATRDKVDQDEDTGADFLKNLTIQILLAPEP